MEESTQEKGGKMRFWLQDNLRIIISILIVFVIALGIYSYSKRTQLPGEELQVSEETTQENKGSTPQEKTTESATEKEAPAISQETEQSFIESAAKGDGMTTLARRALANYLEKNPDTALTAEHKIYIEDFLRKRVPTKRIFSGTSVEFSKSLIEDAIAKSKNLNERQLKNLHKYAVRVPSLT